jgi:S-sulfo-L-cysteine synthase (3-phospho-L-serine-dependent)
VAVPAFRVASSAVEAIRAAGEIGFPVVVKPLDGSGSVGVRACATPLEVGRQAATLVSRAAAAGEPRRVLVEALVGGAEYSVEVFSGRVVGITRKHLGDPPAFVEAGHDYPADVPDDVARALVEAATRGTAVLGLGWGPLHWELRVEEGRAVPIEVNPRLAGGFIPELVRRAEGIDLIRETLRLVVGETPDLARRRHGHASIRFLFAPVAGRLGGAAGIAEASAEPGVEEVALYRSPGDELAIHGDFRDRIGHVLACAERPAAAAAAAERGSEAVRIEVDLPAPYVRPHRSAPLVGVGEGAA